jgi:hypothetical protein
MRFNLFSPPAKRVAVLVAAAIAALTVSAAQAEEPTVELRAYGTAVVDGVQGPGEWEGAAKWDFAVNVPPSGTVLATLHAMNDGANLYLAVKVPRPDLGTSSLNFAFDNNHDFSTFEEGDDVLILSRFGFTDMFVSKQPPCPPTYTCVGIADTEVGGTSEGSGLVRTEATQRFYELSHPLDTPDNGHDFSLRFGKRVGFRLWVSTCAATCVSTSAPYADIRVTSTSTVPPETKITRGPANGSFSRNDAIELAFAGSDDAVLPEDLRFECSQVGDSFEACDAPFEYTPDIEGPQSFRVRAIDEVGNVDPTPAIRRWTFDTQQPNAPSIRGPRQFKQARVVYRLGATDNVDRPKQLRFRCSLDRRPLKQCSARLVLRVRPGRHVLSVIPVDRTGNVGKRTQVRFVRVKSR